jgi:hypothetical protein
VEDRPTFDRKATTGDNFDLDFDSQSFAQPWNRGWPDGATGAVIGFRVVERDTVDALYQRLTTAAYSGQHTLGYPPRWRSAIWGGYVPPPVRRSAAEPDAGQSKVSPGRGAVEV